MLRNREGEPSSYGSFKLDWRCSNERRIVRRRKRRLIESFDKIIDPISKRTHESFSREFFPWKAQRACSAFLFLVLSSASRRMKPQKNVIIRASKTTRKEGKERIARCASHKLKIQISSLCEKRGGGGVRFNSHSFIRSMILLKAAEKGKN